MRLTYVVIPPSSAEPQQFGSPLDQRTNEVWSRPRAVAVRDGVWSLRRRHGLPDLVGKTRRGFQGQLSHMSRTESHGRSQSTLAPAQLRPGKADLLQPHDVGKLSLNGRPILPPPDSQEVCYILMYAVTHSEEAADDSN